MMRENAPLKIQAGELREGDVLLPNVAPVGDAANETVAESVSRDGVRVKVVWRSQRGTLRADLYEKDLVRLVRRGPETEEQG